MIVARQGQQSQPFTGPYKLECYITLGWKGFHGGLVYSLKLRRKYSVANTAPGAAITTILFLAK
jgi:hypothetical protein